MARKVGRFFYFFGILSFWALIAWTVVGCLVGASLLLPPVGKVVIYVLTVVFVLGWTTFVVQHYILHPYPKVPGS